MTDATRREKVRLRSEHWRRGARHRPTTARKTPVAGGRRLPPDMIQAAQAGAAAGAVAYACATLDRAEAFAVALTCDLDQCAALERETMAILAETSNLPFEDWTSVFGSQRLTGALLDRLTHHVHILELNGESYRLKQSTARRRRAAQTADEKAAAADSETGEITTAS
jgi:IstB-like ATP binding protein